MQLIGDFYRDQILRRNDLVYRQIPVDLYEPPEIIEHLFGWELRSDGSVVDCRSEVEARYLQIFVELGLHEVAVPDSEEYLKKILPDLEYLKNRVDEILTEYLETVFDPRIKLKVRRQVYAEITNPTQQ